MTEKVAAMKKKPNILVIWGDDIGITNLDQVMEKLNQPLEGVA